MDGRFPTAFIVDRAESEKSASSQAFRDSHICVCQGYIFWNMHVALGRALVAFSSFWGAMKDHGLAKPYRKTLNLQTYYRHRGDNKKLNFVSPLLAEWEHWVLSETSAHTEVDTLARIEGLFGMVTTARSRDPYFPGCRPCVSDSGASEFQREFAPEPLDHPEQAHVN
jgi:hypothetical protein